MVPVNIIMVVLVLMPAIIMNLQPLMILIVFILKIYIYYQDTIALEIVMVI